MPTSHLSHLFNSPQETAVYAANLARKLQPGDCILLEGGLGAGKTHFARSLIQSVLLHPEDVPSPTFTLVQTYDTEIGQVWHADLYRIGSSVEIEELGLAEAMEEAICLIEWPDRLADLTPDSALTLTLSMLDQQQARQIEARWSDPKWDSTLHGWLS